MLTTKMLTTKRVDTVVGQCVYFIPQICCPITHPTVQHPSVPHDSTISHDKSQDNIITLQVPTVTDAENGAIDCAWKHVKVIASRVHPEILHLNTKSKFTSQNCTIVNVILYSNPKVHLRMNVDGRIHRGVPWTEVSSELLFQHSPWNQFKSVYPFVCIQWICLLYTSDAADE